MIKAVIVDDDASNRSLNRRLLNEYFPNVSVAAEADSVKTAVATIKNTNPI